MSRTCMPVLRGVALMLAATAVTPVHAAEPAACLSPDPSEWPAASKPYFMILADTSGSMTACTTPPSVYPTECNAAAAGYALNACGMVPSRINDMKCALQKTVQAFAGQVTFGLSSFATYLSNCPAGACISDCGVANGGTCNFDTYACTLNSFPGVADGCGNNPACAAGAGPGAPNFPEGTWRNGGNVLVGVEPQSTGVSNAAELLKYFDGQCGDSKELYAAGGTPIAGGLRSTAQYLRAGWTRWSDSNYCPPLGYTFASPLSAADLACRTVNVILISDGDESCETQSAAVAAAQDLFQNGVLIGTKRWPVRVHVINFAGGTQFNADQIAQAGGTGSAYNVQNSTALIQALGSIVSGALKPEACDNADNDCNGCTDEGFRHHCNVNPVCCAWATAAQRTTCLNNFRASITGANPQGNTALLPCTTAAQQADPLLWLCENPRDVCDNSDNNCDGQIDEGTTKCGNPLHCPSTEMCDGIDNNCNGTVDETCPGGACSRNPEICDGCDNDCNGVADNGSFSAPCGLPAGPGVPPWCTGTLSCKPPQGVTPGQCVAGGGWTACNITPQTETCNGLDDNCNGAVDDGIASVLCVPTGAPPGLNYGANSGCKMGRTACVGGATACQGWVGPSAEVCDGLDNDCDGQVDEGVPGVGQVCGVNQPPCRTGMTACVNGALICQGSTPPTSERCDGVDNDCDGQIDELPLVDAPTGGGGCWTLPGNCCSHGSTSWCPPPGATCSGEGSLTAPCARGHLTCAGGAGWSCVGSQAPSQETCDGVDNDCNGVLDDGMLVGVGAACGSDVGECAAGVIACNAGRLSCDDTRPTVEMCDGDDDDCDGVTDNVRPLACTPAYDAQAFPGPRSSGVCRAGFTLCTNATVSCAGGVAPSAEVCDGLDNDCDGQTDEAGTAPDGIDGSADPLDGNAVLGAMCPPEGSQCSNGTFACVRGRVRCVAPSSSPFERCDGVDNDCDGQTDEPPGDGGTTCGGGLECVRNAGTVQCAQRCGQGEPECPTGQVCAPVTSSADGQSIGTWCVTPASGGQGLRLGERRPGAPPDEKPDERPGCACATPSSGLPLPMLLMGLVLVVARRKGGA